MQNQSWLPTTDLLILDELHKMQEWKNYLKGVFDTKPSQMRILVTGSARLEIYDTLGDSLAGRYFKHCLLPFSPAELFQTQQSIDLPKLIERGGFPEPYLAENTIDASRWRIQYIDSLLSTDVFDIDTIHNIKAMRLLFDLLRTRVGSPISHQNLAEDIGISPITVKRYIQILESLFVVFRVTPFSKNIARSLLKEPKIYFFDTGLVQGDASPKLENLVAVNLLKHTYGRMNALAERRALHYLRTKNGEEVDFALTHDEEVEMIIEVKTSDDMISKNLKKFHQQYGYPAIQLVQFLHHSYQQKNIQVRDVSQFLSELYI